MTVQRKNDILEKPIKSACAVFKETSTSAVPALPHTSFPDTFAKAPEPLSTHFRISFLSSFAVDTLTHSFNFFGELL